LRELLKNGPHLPKLSQKTVYGYVFL